MEYATLENFGKQIHSACLLGLTARINDALAKGASPNSIDEGGLTPLHRCAQGFDPQYCELLLDAGAQINAIDDFGQTALHGAAESGCTATCEFLVSRGAHLEARTSNQSTPLRLAARRGHGAACAALIRAGANTDDFVEFCTRNNHMDSLAVGQAAMHELAMVAKINDASTTTQTHSAASRRTRMSI